MVADTVAAVRRDRGLYKLTIFVLKVIPVCLAICDILNTFFWLFDIDFSFLSYIGGVSFLTLIFLYLSSIVFKFCFYHRVFLHYVTANNIISTLDYYNIIGINYIIYLITIGLLLFALLYIHIRRYNIKVFNRNSREK